jgi:hypothetical protein
MQSEYNDALKYREAEVPFVVDNIPDLEKAVDAMAKDVELTAMMGGDVKYIMDSSESPHFMFYNKAGADALLKANQSAAIIRPTTEMRLTFSRWLKRAYDIADEMIGEEMDQLPAWWAEADDGSVRADPFEAPHKMSEIPAEVQQRLREARIHLARLRKQLAAAAAASAERGEEEPAGPPGASIAKKADAGSDADAQELPQEGAAQPNGARRSLRADAANGNETGRLLLEDSELNLHRNPYQALIREQLEALKTPYDPEELFAEGEDDPGHITIPRFVLPKPAVVKGAKQIPSTPTHPSLLPYLEWPAPVELSYGLRSPRAVVKKLSRSLRRRFYLHVAGGYTDEDRRLENPWIGKYMRFLAPSPDREATLFNTDPDGYEGTHCRFGQPGIIAETHYDSGRNFIAMARGYKRYILLPPDQCAHLDIMKDGLSARHSSLDWTDAETILNGPLKNAKAIEVILEPGQALYLPANWFHFIVSLTLSVQCNARSGTSPVGNEQIAQCGLPPSPTTEKIAEFTSKLNAPPFTTGIVPEALAKASKLGLRLTDLSAHAPPLVVPPLEFASFKPLVLDNEGEVLEAGPVTIEDGDETLVIGKVITTGTPEVAEPELPEYKTVDVAELVPEDARIPVGDMLALLRFENRILTPTHVTGEPVANSRPILPGATRTGAAPDGVQEVEGPAEGPDVPEEPVVEPPHPPKFGKADTPPVPPEASDGDGDGQQGPTGADGEEPRDPRVPFKGAEAPPAPPSAPASAASAPTTPPSSPATPPSSPATPPSSPAEPPKPPEAPAAAPAAAPGTPGTAEPALTPPAPVTPGATGTAGKPVVVPVGGEDPTKQPAVVAEPITDAPIPGAGDGGTGDLDKNDPQDGDKDNTEEVDAPRVDPVEISGHASDPTANAWAGGNEPADPADPVANPLIEDPEPLERDGPIPPQAPGGASPTEARDVDLEQAAREAAAAQARRDEERETQDAARMKTAALGTLLDAGKKKDKQKEKDKDAAVVVAVDKKPEDSTATIVLIVAAAVFVILLAYRNGALHWLQSFRRVDSPSRSTVKAKKDDANQVELTLEEGNGGSATGGTGNGWDNWGTTAGAEDTKPLNVASPSVGTAAKAPVPASSSSDAQGWNDADGWDDWDSFESQPQAARKRAVG